MLRKHININSSPNSQVFLEMAEAIDEKKSSILGDAKFSWKDHAYKTAANEDYLYFWSNSKKITGFILYKKQESEIEILHLVCIERGEGFHMIDEYLSSLSEVKKVFLEFRVNNLSAKKVYDKAGFKEIGQRKNYYSDGTDAVQMLKEL